LEISFDKEFKLKQIGLQVEAAFGMKPGAESYSDAVVHAVGCLTYTSASETFVASLAAEVDAKGICAEATLGLVVSPGQFKLDVGTRENRIKVFPGCGSSNVNGWVGIDRNNGVTNVQGGIGVDRSFEFIADIEIAKFIASGGFDLTAAGKIQVEPSIQMKEVSVEFNAYASIAIESFIYDGTLLSIGLHGLIAYHFQTKRLHGTVAAHVVVGEILDEEVDFDLDITL